MTQLKKVPHLIIVLLKMFVSILARVDNSFVTAASTSIGVHTAASDYNCQPVKRSDISSDSSPESSSLRKFMRFRWIYI